MTKIFQNSEYLGFVKNYLNHILKITENGIKKREISDQEIQVFKTLPRYKKGYNELLHNLTQSNIKVFIKKDLIKTRNICKEFISWMNKMCEEFAHGYHQSNFQ